MMVVYNHSLALIGYSGLVERSFKFTAPEVGIEIKSPISVGLNEHASYIWAPFFNVDASSLFQTIIYIYLYIQHASQVIFCCQFISGADLIHAEALKFHLSETTCFKYVIRLAKFAPPDFEPPKRKFIGGRLVNSNNDEFLRRTIERLSRQQEEFGLSLMGYGATVKIMMPMVNMLCSDVHEPTGCLEIADCTGHV
jgi:hypothetical protein